MNKNPLHFRLPLYFKNYRAYDMSMRLFPKFGAITERPIPITINESLIYNEWKKHFINMKVIDKIYFARDTDKMVNDMDVP